MEMEEKKQYHTYIINFINTNKTNVHYNENNSIKIFTNEHFRVNEIFDFSTNCWIEEIKNDFGKIEFSIIKIEKLNDNYSKVLLS